MPLDFATPESGLEYFKSEERKKRNQELWGKFGQLGRNNIAKVAQITRGVNYNQNLNTFLQDDDAAIKALVNADDAKKKELNLEVEAFGNGKTPDYKGLGIAIIKNKDGKISDIFCSGPLYAEGPEGDRGNTYVNSGALKGMDAQTLATAFGNKKLYTMRPDSKGVMQKIEAPFDAKELQALYQERDQTRALLEEQREREAKARANFITINANNGKVEIHGDLVPINVSIIKGKQTIDFFTNNTAASPQQLVPPVKVQNNHLKIEIDDGKINVQLNDKPLEGFKPGQDNYITIYPDGRVTCSQTPPAWLLDKQRGQNAQQTEQAQTVARNEYNTQAQKNDLGFSQSNWQKGVVKSQAKQAVSIGERAQQNKVDYSELDKAFEALQNMPNFQKTIKSSQEFNKLIDAFQVSRQDANVKSLDNSNQALDNFQEKFKAFMDTQASQKNLTNEVLKKLNDIYKLVESLQKIHTSNNRGEAPVVSQNATILQSSQTVPTPPPPPAVNKQKSSSEVNSVSNPNIQSQQLDSKGSQSISSPQTTKSNVQTSQSTSVNQSQTSVNKSSTESKQSISATAQDGTNLSVKQRTERFENIIKSNSISPPKSPINKSSTDNRGRVR